MRETYGSSWKVIQSAMTMIAISEVDKRPGTNFRRTKHLRSARDKKNRISRDVLMAFVLSRAALGGPDSGA